MEQALFAQISPPDALLFDLDGTLVDSVPDIAAAIDAMLLQLEFAVAGEGRVRQWVGNGALKLVERALAYSLSVSESVVDRQQLRQAHQIFLTHYQLTNARHSRLYPGVREALELWRQHNIPMAVVTNKPIEFVPELLNSLGIGEYFQVLLGGECVPEKKPAPAMLLLACEQLQRAPDRCLMIGDSRNDVDAARAAGMPVVAVSYGYNHGESIADTQPDLLVDSLAELCGRLS